MKYHVTPEGFFRQCHAEGRACPLGGDHDESMAALARRTFAPANFVPQNAPRPAGPVMPFGKFKGMPVSDLVRDQRGYCLWLVEQENFFMDYPSLHKRVREGLGLRSVSDDLHRIGRRAQ